MHVAKVVGQENFPEPWPVHRWPGENQGLGTIIRLPAAAPPVLSPPAAEAGAPAAAAEAEAESGVVASIESNQRAVGRVGVAGAELMDSLFASNGRRAALTTPPSSTCVSVSSNASA